MKKINVTENAKLLDYLYKQKLNLSKSKLKSLLKHECIFVDQEVKTQFDHPLKKGQVISIIPYNYQRDLPFEIIYENRDVIVINKPEAMMTLGQDRQMNKSAFDHVQNYLKAKYKNPSLFVVHRLDRDTSGVLLFAKNQHTQKRYQDNWNQLAKKRKYLAIIQGQMPQKKGSIRSFLQEDENTFVYSAKEGKEAITHYELIRKNEHYSLLNIELETGRKNQIRVHLSEAQHPVVGDKKYGSKVNPLQRMALHAHELRIEGKRFIAKTPRSFRNLVK